MKGNGFRVDINGLRAWAVVSVILFHFGVKGFSGGFSGVDIFFVISGFLMTGIILNGLEAAGRSKKGFSIVDFYLSRARRIIPALLVLCFFLLIFGWFALPAIDYRKLGFHVISALGFFSNIVFWRESGYFDAASHDKLLLHTWSLSVEWQFYLILPVVLWIVWKLRPGRNSLIIVTTFLLTISFLLSAFVTASRPDLAFYLLPFRAWEMLAGGMVLLLNSNLMLSDYFKRWLEVLGFSLIIFAILFFDSETPWPSWRALVPVAGTVLVLIAARQNSFLTGTIFAQWLGKTSYSLYLWHWPLAVLLVWLDLKGHVLATVAACIFTLVLGWFSYRLVEQSARLSLSRLTKGPTTVLIFGLVSLVCAPAMAIYLTAGVPSGRLSPEIQAVAAEAKNKDPRPKTCPKPGVEGVSECTYGGPELGLIVLGDSHAAAIAPSIDKALPTKDKHVLAWTMSACQTIFGLKDRRYPNFHCGDFLSYALKRSQDLPKDIPLVIINRTSVAIFGQNEISGSPKPDKYLNKPYSAGSTEFFSEMRSGIIETACEFAKTRPVYMMRPIPELRKSVPTTMARSLIFGRKTDIRVSVSLDEYHRRQDFVWKTQDMAAERCGIKILNPLPLLCSEGRCWGDKDGMPIYADDDHLNRRGAEIILPMFRKIFER